MEMAKYADKNAVIIGGTHGMGLATAKVLLEGGAQVFVTGRNEQNVGAARSELGHGAHVVRSDASSLTEIKALPSLVREKLGGIDLLFINAGVSEIGPFDQVTEATYDRMFDVNAKGAFFTAQYLAPLIRQGGSIVFTTVTNGPANPNLSVYAGTKAAVRAFAQVIAAELVSKGIRVNTVAPGFTDTPTLGVAELSDAERQVMRKLGDEITPMKRHASTDEIARAALFLAFDATFSTGVELPVDGGLAQIGHAL
jgi:NAD(P)-dependent dehydrogenase (short-subunit alcohol dehydrogenase family)